MKECRQCEATIDDTETAVFDGVSWFCDEGCQARYTASLASDNDTGKTPTTGRFNPFAK